MKAVADQEAVRADWEARLGAARSELADAESSSGGDLIDDPKSVSRVAKRMQTARDEIELGERALAEAGLRLENARRRVLEHDASEIDQQADRLQAELDKHDARTAELLADLQEHEGRFVPEVDWIEALRSAIRSGVANDGAPEEWEIPKSRLKREQIMRLRLQADVVRDVAAGVDPSIRLRASSAVGDRSIYPACVWGPDAVVGAPAYLSLVENARARLAEIDETLGRLPAEIEELEVEQAAKPDRVLIGLQGRRRQLEELPGRREQVAAELAALTGAVRPPAERESAVSESKVPAGV